MERPSVPGAAFERAIRRPISCGKYLQLPLRPGASCRPSPSKMAGQSLLRKPNPAYDDRPIQAHSGLDFRFPEIKFVVNYKCSELALLLKRATTFADYVSAMSPLTPKGEEIKEAMKETYGSEKKAEQVLYASKNAGTITGIDADPERIFRDHVAGGINEAEARELAFGENGPYPVPRHDD